MKIKKFVANSMPEAMKQIKDKLGNDAIILNSKEIKSPGFFGFFSKKKIEVTAMLDEDIQTPKRSRRQKKSSEEQFLSHPVNKTSGVNEAQILDEIKHIQSILSQQTTHVDQSFPPMLQNVYEYLLSQEVETTLATEIVESIMEKIERIEPNRESIQQLLKEAIINKLSNATYEPVNDDTKIIQFVGPTGVGKTTTIAKIAAQKMLHNKYSVAFITADTYRIAAIEQLKTYATILGIPLEVVYSKEDYKKALQKFSTYDLIFVDTAGRNYREDRYIHELKQLITTPSYNAETFLVLSSTAKASDLIDIFEQFKQLAIEQVIFTKLDETESYGGLLNLIAKEQINVTYITDGQDVPDDLVEPSETHLAKLLLGRYSNA